VVRGEHTERLGGGRRQQVLAADDRRVVRGAQPGRPQVGRGVVLVNRVRRALQRGRPRRVGGGRGQRQPGVAQQGGVVGAGQDSAILGRLWVAQQHVLRHEAHLAGLGGNGRVVADDGAGGPLGIGQPER
jgi:hypothetical protein